MSTLIGGLMLRASFPRGRRTIVIIVTIMISLAYLQRNRIIYMLCCKI
jgi:hypothetical protein